MVWARAYLSHQVPPGLPALLSLHVDLPGSWTVTLTSNALSSSHWNPGRLQVPIPRSLFSLTRCSVVRPAGIGPVPSLFPGLSGLDRTPFFALSLGATCRLGGTGRDRSGSEHRCTALTCAAVTPAEVTSPRSPATPCVPWRLHSPLVLCSLGLQLPGRRAGGAVAINTEQKD